MRLNKTYLNQYFPWFCSIKILPIYKVISNTGPRHKPNFKVAVKLKDSNFVEATGNSKKNAEQAAATSLLNILNL